MKHALLAIAALVVLAAPVAAQTTPPRNPTAIAFTSEDHDNPELTGYEVDFVRNVDQVVVQTVVVPKASSTRLSTGEIGVTVNVQPTAFGTYTFTVRAVAGAVKSGTSLPSEVWQRAPGAPGRPLIR